MACTNVYFKMMVRNVFDWFVVVYRDLGVVCAGLWWFAIFQCSRIKTVCTLKEPMADHIGS